jgi:hydrogenase-4 component H
VRQPKIRELGEAVRAIIKGPYTTKFPKEPSPAAPRYRGIIVFIEEKCIGCGACVEVCPALAREIRDEISRGVRQVIHYQDRCIYCGECVDRCPTQALRHTQDYDLSDFSRDNYVELIEKELVFCEICGEPITTRDQLRWIARRVGELAYCNPNLIIGALSDLGLVEPGAPPGPISPYRSNTQRLLCPKCRRQTHLQETWGY